MRFLVFAACMFEMPFERHRHVPGACFKDDQNIHVHKLQLGLKGFFQSFYLHTEL